MHRDPTNGCPHPPGAMFARWWSRLAVGLAGCLLLAATICWGLSGQTPELSQVEMTRNDEGL